MAGWFCSILPEPVPKIQHVVKPVLEFVPCTPLNAPMKAARHLQCEVFYTFGNCPYTQTFPSVLLALAYHDWVLGLVVDRMGMRETTMDDIGFLKTQLVKLKAMASTNA